MAMSYVPNSQDILQLKNLLKDVNNTKLLQEIRRRLEVMNWEKSLMLGNHTPSCVRYVEEHPDLTNESYMMIIFGILYLHIFVLGLIGNTAILYLTVKNRHLQTVQNIFILNLAVSDVLICLTSLPITPITNIYKAWYFGSPICKLIPLVQGCSVFVSTLSLAAIALDRYILVVKPHKHPLNSRGASIVALCLWIVSVLVCMPYGWYMDVEKIGGLCGEYCTEKWPLPAVRKGYTFMVLGLQFVFPIVTMGFCYYNIFARLKDRAEKKLNKLNERTMLLENSVYIEKVNMVSSAMISDGVEEKLPSLEDKQRQTVVAQQRRTTTILLSMVALFVIAWLPHNVITLIIEYDEGIFHMEHMDHTYLVSMITHLISMTTNVANPFLYAWLNPSFKEILLKTLRRRKTTTAVMKSTIIRFTSTVPGPEVQERSF